jgi:hypothetical protein
LLYLIAVGLTVIVLSIGVPIAFSASITGWLVYLGVSLVGLTLGWRAALTGLCFDDKGVRVRTLGLTRILPWTQIRRFVIDEADLSPIELNVRFRYGQWQDNALYGIFVVMKDGRLIGTPLRCGPPPKSPTLRDGLWDSNELLSPREVQYILETLHHELARHS